MSKSTSSGYLDGYGATTLPEPLLVAIDMAQIAFSDEGSLWDSRSTDRPRMIRCLANTVPVFLARPDHELYGPDE